MRPFVRNWSTGLGDEEEDSPPALRGRPRELQSPVQPDEDWEEEIEEEDVDEDTDIDEIVELESPLPHAGFLSESGKTIQQFHGPILFTAPHGISLLRPGCRPHGREYHTTRLALLLSRFMRENLGGDSFIIWNEKVVKDRDPSNLDPNYTVASQFPQCPFNQGLVRFRDVWYAPSRHLQLKENFPCTFHLDLHGKSAKRRQILDIGIVPMEVLWTDEDEVERLKSVLVRNFKNAFRRINRIRQGAGQVPFEVRGDPALHGFWGNDTVTTQSHQSVLLHMPAVQLEMPPVLRRLLASDSLFLQEFGNAIVRTYHEVWFTDFGRSEAQVEKRARLLRGLLRKGNPEMKFEEYLSFMQRQDDPRRRRNIRYREPTKKRRRRLRQQ